MALRINRGQGDSNLPARKEWNLNRLIIGVAGVACQAFPLFGRICKEYGNLTLGELAKMTGYCMIWRAQ